MLFAATIPDGLQPGSPAWMTAMLNVEREKVETRYDARDAEVSTFLIMSSILCFDMTTCR
jgi:hypothetical protein